MNIGLKRSLKITMFIRLFLYLIENGIWNKIYNKYKNKLKHMNIKKFSELNEEITLTISKRVEVPEKDITEAIEAIKNWFDKNTSRDICKPSMFGHDIWKVNRKSIDKDVRECAKNARPYTKK